MRILATVSYCGTNYQGWQKQPNGDSVQETIENTLSRYFSREIKIYGSGRTDAGVHAVGQTFHFDIDDIQCDLDKMKYSFNCMLPEDIKIESLTLVNNDFHARFSATGKVYRYRIILDGKDVFNYKTAMLCPYPLKWDEFEKTLTHFVGKHDFKNFTSKEEDDDQFIREIFSIECKWVNKKELEVYLCGNGFMRYMIRFIIGSALDVARGKIAIEEIDNLLQTSERHIISSKAPSEGLTLMKVIY